MSNQVGRLCYCLLVPPTSLRLNTGASEINAATLARARIASLSSFDVDLVHGVVGPYDRALYSRPIRPAVRVGVERLFVLGLDEDPRAQGKYRTSYSLR